jgi:hypothetical protein
MYNHKGCTYRAPVSFVTKTANVFILQYPDMLHTVLKELDYRVNVYIIRNGAHTEQL